MWGWRWRVQCSVWREGSRHFSRERNRDRSYSFSLTWKPPSYMVHGLVSAHLEVTKGVGRHFSAGGCALGAPHLTLIRFSLSLESWTDPSFPFMSGSCYTELRPYAHTCANTVWEQQLPVTPFDFRHISEATPSSFLCIRAQLLLSSWTSWLFTSVHMICCVCHNEPQRCIS